MRYLLPASLPKVMLLLLGVATLIHVRQACAEQLAELSDEFLEYLGSLEGDDEDWMDFAVTAKSGNAPASSSQSAALAKVSSSSSSSSVMSKAAAQAGGKAEK